MSKFYVLWLFIIEKKYIEKSNILIFRVIFFFVDVVFFFGLREIVFRGFVLCFYVKFLFYVVFSDFFC